MSTTARRQASTTSLSKYARSAALPQNDRMLDFCNSFWGLGDGGVDVLFTRMRGAARTMDELKAFWRERALIEEEYSKRLTKLAKQALGKDEIGELRNSIDTLRLETDKQASSHSHLAQQLRTDLEGPVAEFVARQVQHRKTYQAAIERAFKAKQTQESYVNKAREKYEADCLRINSYTAQSTLVQGKDLEKIHLKLERAQQTVQANERDFANFARALADTSMKWERDWKSFSDVCQDLEEERIEFMKDSMWGYANAVSTVCVADDESCEHLRVALEQLEPEKDIENFVRDFGTGNQIPDPPQFVNYTNPDAIPPTRNTSRPALFARSSQRPPAAERNPPVATEEQEEDIGNAAGIGARGVSTLNGVDGAAGSTVHSPTPAPLNGATPDFMNRERPHSRGAGGLSNNTTTSPASYQSVGGASKSKDPTAPKTMLTVGGHAYEVDPTKDPQGQRGSGKSATIPNGVVGQDGDPLARTMNELQNAASIGVRRKQSTRPQVGGADVSSSSRSPESALSPPPGGTAPSNRDYRNSAEFIVGSHPSASRPTSPTGQGRAAPTAEFLRRPSSRGTSPIPVEEIVADYGQALPGERRRSISVSRQNSTGRGTTPAAAAIGRPVSREGFVGIGAGGARSASPHGAQSVSPSLQPPGPGGYSQQQQHPGQRAASPSMGIALDATGNVTHDDMAVRYQEQQQGAYGGYQQPQQPLAGYQQQQQHRVTPAPPPPQASMTHPQQQYISHMQQQQQQAPQPSPTHPSMYNPYSQQAPYSAAPTPSHVGYPQPPGGYPGGGANGLHRGQSASVSSQNSYYTQGYQQSPQGQQPPYSNAYNTGAARPPSPQPPQMQHPPPQSQPQPGQRGPPTGQYTEDGKGVLFYVKALYDYQATIDEEFDFQSGDVLAVTSTPEDGWWTGELLDEKRRIPGRNVFPSNFVCLF